MSSRSNSASEANRLSLGRVGVDGVGQGNQADAPALQVGHQVEQVLERAAQPVELVDVDRVARAHLQQQLVEFNPGGQRAGGFFLVDELVAGLGQGVELELQVLVAGGDAGVANLHVEEFTKLIS